jgi:hypothetical protein
LAHRGNIFWEKGEIERDDMPRTISLIAIIFFTVFSELCSAQVIRPQPRINEPIFRVNPNRKVSIFQTSYHGWQDSWVLKNGKAEVVVVPTIGRIMQFRLIGQEGVFWENRALDGRKPTPFSSEWTNFGGDKTWPSPQADWPAFISRAWPPPQAFDSMPVTAVADERSLILTSPVDPQYGVRTVRRIQLDHSEPTMTISTTFEKVQGKPVKIGIWVISQLKDPEVVFMPVPPTSRFSAGYTAFSKEIPPSLRVEKNLLSMKRDSQKEYKIGGDGNSLIWLGKECGLLIDSPRVADAQYPDEGSSMEIYTNPDPLPYVELETLGPVKELKPGDAISRVNKYTLFRRTSETPAAEVRNLFK